MAKHHCRPFQPYRLALLSSCTSLYNCSTTRFVHNTNLATAYNHGHPRPKYTSVYILGLQVCKANLLLRRTSGIRAASEQTFRKPFEIDDADTRNTVKKYRRRIFDTLRTLFYRMTP